jgi:hypothetical protein
VKLQETIEAPEQLFGIVITIAKRAHVRHMLFHHLTEEASEHGQLP